MLTPIALTIAAFLPQGTPKPDNAPESILDQLIERSRRIKTCRARLSFTNSEESKPKTIRWDYQAPDSLRGEFIGDGSSMSVWSIGTSFCMRALENGERSWAKFDCQKLLLEDVALERELARVIPNRQDVSGDRVNSPGARMHLQWNFDESSDEGSFQIGVMTLRDGTSPYGWLSELKLRKSEPAMNTDRLHFETDGGRCRIDVARSSGFLEQFVAQGPHATITLKLQSVEFDRPIDVDRIAFPTDAFEGRDDSVQYRLMMTKGWREMMRWEVYEAAASVADDSWSDDVLLRIEPAFHSLYENIVTENMEFVTKHSQEVIQDAVTNLWRMRDAPEAQIHETRGRYRQSLLQSIDAADEAFRSGIKLPRGATSSERAGRLLETERNVGLKVFQARTREPLLESFNQRTADATK